LHVKYYKTKQRIKINQFLNVFCKHKAKNQAPCKTPNKQKSTIIGAKMKIRLKCIINLKVL